jgi:pimeloyl-ACP methyl ester carboxylesterase
MAEFCLVHGAYHAPGCWERLERELRRRGHAAMAVDLPCEDPSAGALRYADTVAEALEGTGEHVVLVGHSLADLVVPLVAHRRPARLLVYLCGLLPAPGRSLRDQTSSEPIAVEGWPREDSWIAHDDGTYSWKEDAAIEFFYHDCAAEDARWAVSLLRRQGQLPITEVTPLAEWPTTPSVYVLCREDRVVNPDWGRTAARERLGADAIELPGGHAPFVSRPAELAEILAESAVRQP